MSIDLFVNLIGLPWAADDQALREAFASFGEVTEGNCPRWSNEIIKLVNI